MHIAGLFIRKLLCMLLFHRRVVYCCKVTIHTQKQESYFEGVVRERPFTLKGGVWFISKKNILIPNVAEKNILILVGEKK